MACTVLYSCSLLSSNIDKNHKVNNQQMACVIERGNGLTLISWATIQNHLTGIAIYRESFIILISSNVAEWPSKGPMTYPDMSLLVNTCDSVK